MRTLLIVPILLLGVTWATAQTKPDNSGQASYNQESNGKSGADRSVQGCLSESSGSYTLTSDTGKTYMLGGDTSKLAEHVGHEVLITGTRKSAGNMTAPSGETAGAMSNQANEPMLDVVSVKHVSKTCKKAGAMSH